MILDVNPSTVNRLVNNQRPLDAEKAITLGEVFGLQPDIFLELQKQYDLAQARLRIQPNPERALRAQLYSNLPVREMIQRGWISAKGVKDTEKVQQELARFFGVEKASEISLLPHAAKKTDAGTDLSPAQSAWLYRTRSIAQEQVVGRYSPGAVREAIQQLSRLRADESGVRKVPAILSSAGVRFVVVETLSSAKIDGVCFWLNDFAPVVGMTVRYDRIDNFWFVLRHELEHVLQGHGRSRERIDVNLEGEKSGTGSNIPTEERVANAAAADFCVPREQMEKFFTRKNPYFKERDVLGFAATVGAHPGLVVGQLRHLGGRYDMFWKYLVKIRKFVVSTAPVDGWGQQYVLNPNR